MACRPPLVFQNREVKLVAPPALKPLVLHEVRLLSHPEPGCKTSRTVIVGINPGHDAVQAEIVERKMQDPVRGLGRVPLAREGRIEDIADLPAAMLSRMPHQDDVAYQLARCTEFDTQSECLSFGFEGLARPHPMHAIADSGGVHRFKRDVPTYLRKRSVGDKRLDVLLRDRTKGQPWGAKRIARMKRHGRTGCPNCRPTEAQSVSDEPMSSRVPETSARSPLPARRRRGRIPTRGAVAAGRVLTRFRGARRSALDETGKRRAGCVRPRR